jgi:glycosyltransferase involved in cell wall biosynthesis
MKLGIVIEETWSFFHEIYADLAAHHAVNQFARRDAPLPIFKERLGRRRFRNDLQAFMRANDVVFFEWASELLAAASHQPKTCGIVTRLHRYELYEWADRINWDVVDRIILVSEAKRREFVSRFPEQSPKVIVIPEAVSLQRFTPQTRQFSGNIGILCHLKPRKRVYDLILAFYELTRQQSNLHLHIGGGQAEGYEEYPAALQSLVDRLGLRSKVTFYDHIAHPEQWYGQIDIFISNSYSEGLQVAPMEAMATGCFCLSHFWEGADELLPAENLFYTERELVERIVSYCGLPEVHRQQIGDRMRQIVVDNFDVDKTKLQIRAIIEDVAAS